MSKDTERERGRGYKTHLHCKFFNLAFVRNANVYDVSCYRRIYVRRKSWIISISLAMFRPCVSKWIFSNIVANVQGVPLVFTICWFRFANKNKTETSCNEKLRRVTESASLKGCNKNTKRDRHDQCERFNRRGTTFYSTNSNRNGEWRKLNSEIHNPRFSTHGSEIQKSKIKNENPLYNLVFGWFRNSQSGSESEDILFTIRDWRYRSAPASSVST